MFEDRKDQKDLQVNDLCCQISALLNFQFALNKRDLLFCIKISTFSVLNLFCQDIAQKLLEACSEIAGSSLEQATFFRRNPTVKPGPQIDVTTEMDELTTDAEVVGEFARILCQ